MSLELTVLDLSHSYEPKDTHPLLNREVRNLAWDKARRTYLHESEKKSAFTKPVLLFLTAGAVMLVTGLIFAALSLVSPVLLVPAFYLTLFSTTFFIVPGLCYAGYVYLPRAYRIAKTFFMNCNTVS